MKQRGNPETWRQVEESQALVELIRPLLAGRDRAVQAAALADLLAIWLAGHRPSMREVALAEHVKCVIALTDLEARENKTWDEDRQ